MRLPILLLLAAALAPLPARAGTGAAVAAPRPTAAEASPRTDTARRVVHLLQYVASDYGGAVRNGAVVSASEYREQQEFVARIGDELTALGVPAHDPLRDGLAALESAVRGRASRATVAARAHALERVLRGRYDLHALPPRTPSLADGKALFATHCASCHGMDGRGDGPAAAGLTPPPADLRDRARMLAQSPFALFNTISYGVEGTAMPAFVHQLSDAQRYDLAFFVGSLAFRPKEIEHGRDLVVQMPERIAGAVPDVAALVEKSADALASNPEQLSVVAYLRTHPGSLKTGGLPVELARQRLADSWNAYRAGDRERSLELAVSAYLDGFEPLEPALDGIDRSLRQAVEADFAHYRSLLHSGRPPAEIEPIYSRLRGRLDEAEQRLAGGGLGPAALFASALAIIAREGFEAVLVVVALYGILIRAERRDAVRYLHAGWLAALPAGAATWLAARFLVEVSGAQREVIEGVTALTATAILFYVSYWLISKTQSSRWQAFIDRKVRTALSRGSLWGLAGISFVAVYRELFETILFYEALWAQAGPGGQRSILLGIGAGALLLAALAAALFRFGRRLSIRRFFAASSLLLYALAIILAGDGIAALQEVGWIPVTWVPGIRIDWLGLHPTAQGLAVQGALILAALAVIPFAWLTRPARVQRAGGERGHPAS